MEAITTDKNGNPIGIGTIVRTDETVRVPERVGSVVEVVFRDEVTLLKIAGVRGMVEHVNAVCVDFTEFESVLFNEFSIRKVYLTEDETHALADILYESAHHGDGENDGQ